ncbi:cytochrome c oxidase assembly protein COX11, mitochondrial-like [Actinia tenebrosa]|uniref:Cytochrome c oxidase assembly protein COX11, mitochondrial n=1 Tax=Actinia tenebrosa TaxID=6105 RepID=A0A6P8HGP8_ACTTE|nr:cytochrome c oxidase assembly protein COX11, mitochondrial-like [Actinia tenebrosa]
MFTLTARRVSQGLHRNIYFSALRSGDFKFASSCVLNSAKRTLLSNCRQTDKLCGSSLSCLWRSPPSNVFIVWGCRSSSSTSTSTSFSGSVFNRNKTTLVYVGAVVLTVLGFSYAAVPLYRLYCQASGLGGTIKQAESGEKIEKMERQADRILRIQFNADTSKSMRWHFKPQQSHVKVAPGETALAFYTATNPTDSPITGISTYNVVPFEAGQYFNKIQCFCFEEQRLNPHEQVDMPVFFYIDPEFTEDPAMAKVDTIILSYTFFESKEAEKMGL